MDSVTGAASQHVCLCLLRMCVSQVLGFFCLLLLLLILVCSSTSYHVSPPFLSIMSLHHVSPPCLSFPQLIGNVWCTYHTSILYRVPAVGGVTVEGIYIYHRGTCLRVFFCLSFSFGYMFSWGSQESFFRCFVTSFYSFQLVTVNNEHPQSHTLWPGPWSSFLDYRPNRVCMIATDGL